MLLDTVEMEFQSLKIVPHIEDSKSLYAVDLKMDYPALGSRLHCTLSVDIIEIQKQPKRNC